MMDESTMLELVEGLEDSQKAELISRLLGQVKSTFTVSLESSDNPQITVFWDYSGCSLEQLQGLIAAETKVRFRPSKRHLTVKELKERYDERVFLAVDAGKKPPSKAEETNAVRSILLRGGYTPEQTDELLKGDPTELGAALTSILASQ